jgi:nucleoside 2-deoxyribosyltransferase
LDWLTKNFDTLQLPSPSNQALNLIRVIGENISKTGNSLVQFPRITPMVGCISHEKLGQLVQELVQKGLIRSSSVQERENPYNGKITWAPTIDLTLDGWERFEAEQKGQLAGKFGFLAMKFNDEVLENFVSDYLKPNVAKETGYELKDVRQFAQAGIIDNIMRAHIRDSAFVIVDLTHDNSGAYWEAGYAEGLGKPVIYICKKDKFDKSSTHFDVNHCTTVMWELGEEGQSVEQVIATIRRSLNLFQ